jgi:glycosyltransferase involved in cell wall biosynthesis
VDQLNHSFQSKFVSVVIPVYNRPEKVLDAMRSVARQSEPPGELWVVDDCSTDGTAAEVRQWIKENAAKYPKTKFNVHVLEDNCGVSASQNAGVDLSSGHWVAFLDSDDLWKKKKLELQLAFLRENPSCRWLHCNERWLRNGEHLNQKKVHRKEGTLGKASFDLLKRSLTMCLISPSAVMLEKSLLVEAKGFDAAFTVCEDFDLWLRLLPEHPLGFVEDVLVEKRGGHADQLSQRYHSMDLWRLRALKKSKPLLQPEVGEDFGLVFRQKLAIVQVGLQKRADQSGLASLANEFAGEVE